MKSYGHWFCDNCDDVVFMTYERTTQSNVSCPVCGHLACNFIPAKLSRKLLPQDWFKAMHRAVDEATTPELMDMRTHYQMRR
jgi:hypothetical protein